MLYHIQGFAPTLGMGSSGFNVRLYPAWKAGWASREPVIGQADADRVVETMGRGWLDGFGYNRKWEYDGEVRPLYDPRTSLRVKWGEWGPEHISVPGNACGLDMDICGMWAPPGGRVLVPHNVDSPDQAGLLLAIFLFFADTLVLDLECREYAIVPAAGG